MKETEFVRQNKDKWSKDEAILANNNAHPDRVSDAFTEITEDLSYASTFYPYRSVRYYLNKQAQQVYFRINKQRFTLAKIKRFWTDELPQAMVESRKDMNLAFFIFLIGMLIGVVSSVYDPEFSRLILGDNYIDKTLENIANGDPMGIYKSSAPGDMFFRITLNNLMVAYRVFVMGIVFSIGSAVTLFYNAIMVGTFQFFFFEQAIFKESILAIWLHGTLEISSIILAGGAGLTLGRGLLFPGTFSRSQAFQLSAQRGLKIMLGISPVFVLAAIIESFATRYTDAPDLLRILIILASLTFILYYYVYFPWKKELQGFSVKHGHDQLMYSDSNSIELREVKSVGSIFSESFLLMRKMGSRPYLVAFLSALVLAMFFVYSNRNNDLLPLVAGDWFVYNLNRYFLFYSINASWWLNYALYLAIIFVLIHRFRKKTMAEGALSKVQIISIAGLLFAWHLLFLFPGNTTWLLLFVLTPLLFIGIAAIVENDKRPKLGRVISLTFTRIFQTYFLSFLLVIVTVILFMIVYTPLLWFYMDVIRQNLDVSEKIYTYIVVISLTTIISTVFFLLISYLFIALSLLVYSNAEFKFGEGLLQQIRSIRVKKTAYGLERE
jgi:uncharacterized membrane protein SpoIIM required for sporulation